MASKVENSVQSGFGMVRKHGQDSSDWWRAWGDLELCDVRNKEGQFVRKLHPVLKVNLLDLSTEARLTLFEIRGSHEAATPEDVAQTFAFKNTYTPTERLQCLRKGLAELSEIGVVRITGRELNGKIPFDVHPSVKVISFVLEKEQFEDTANALTNVQREVRNRNGKIIITGK